MPASPFVRGCAAGSTESPARGDADGEPFRFDKLREDAWERFLTKSADLAAAHPHRNTLQSREGGWVVAQWIRFFQWLWHVVKGQAEGAPLPGPTHRRGLRERSQAHGTGLRESGPTHGSGLRGSSPTDEPGLRGSGEAAPPRSVRESSDPPRPTNRGDRPGRLGLPGLSGLPGWAGRAERERRTALAVRSARIAGAIRGAQRARVQSCREPVGAQTVGGAAWA